jgi:hypothetical protein
VENNPVLNGVYANPKRAEALTELSAYIYGKNLNGKECLLYGQVPALSFYMDMPPVNNSWSDLSSYGYGVMQEDMDDLDKKISEGKEKPVVILGETANLTQEEKKWALIQEFMIKYQYQRTFQNDTFAVWESVDY